MSDLQKGKVWNEDKDWVAGWMDMHESHSLHGSDGYKNDGTTVELTRPQQNRQRQ
jgi:hypothetical protein